MVGPRRPGRAADEDQERIVVRTQPELARQLGERGPLIFWRDGPAGAREGLAWIVETCKNPKCDCRDALIQAVEVDPFTVTVEAADRATAFHVTRLDPTAGAPEPPSRRTVVRLDIDSGKVVPDPERTEAELVAWIRDEADGDVLDLLQRRWLRGKGLDPEAKDTDIGPEDWEPGDKLLYGLAFPGDRNDIFVLEDRVMLANEMLCAEPGCRCGEAEVFFEEYRSGRKGRPPRAIGSVVVRVADGTGTIESETPTDRDLMERLWAVYRRRHRVAARLAQRQQRTQEIGKLLIAQRREVKRPTTPTEQVGRNDPCPCGSGKKYKKCHGA